MTESRLDYIELLQQQVSKNTTKLLDVCTEEDHEESAQSSRPTLPTLCSVPRNLTISPGLGGAALTPQLTEGVRRILFGGTFHVFNYEWKKSVFRFRETHTEFSYALHTDRCGARAVQMAVQARIIKHLLFSSDGRPLHSLTQVGQREQEKALAAALADSLWLAGDDVSATVTLVTEDYCITPHLDYKLDHVTERLQLFTFTQKEDVTRFILEHIQCFTEEGSHGVILFLYSLVCSRSVHRLREDLDCPTSHLLYRSLGNFVCRQALVNLLLTGRASPHVFNGTACCGPDGRPLERPLQGVMTRCDVGYLHWSREERDARRLPQVGSMLKTPLFPVWLCCINRSFSVTFSTNRSLLSDWKMEHVFTLLYYSGQNAQSSTARITVDTQSHHWEAPVRQTDGQTDRETDRQTERHWEAPVRQTDGDPEKHFPSLDMTIRTKWAGAAISWNGTTPFY